MRAYALCAFLLYFCCSPVGYAHAQNFTVQKADNLIKICGQLEEALEYLDGLSKLVFDADPDQMLAAGYCLGVLTEYRRGNYNDCHYTVIEGAKRISKMKKGRYSLDELLRRTCR